MNRASIGLYLEENRVPRASGDEPEQFKPTRKHLTCSPRERG